MFKRIRTFVYNHRRKFIFSGAFFSIIIMLARYARSKLRESQEKELNELLEKTRRRQHFESAERTCDQTVLVLSGDLRTAIVKCLDCEKVVNELRKKTAEKISLWNNLKILAISRTATIIYSYTMIVIFLRIQFNVLAGALYKESFSNESSQNIVKIDAKMKQDYLSLSRYLIENGIEKLSLLIQDQVKSVTSNYSLADKLHLRDIQNIYWALTSSVSAIENKDPVKNFSSYIINPDLIQNNETTKIIPTKLLDETLDLLESQEVQNLMQTNLRSGFTLLIDRISEYFNDNDNSKGDGDTSKENTYINLNSITMSMAKIIPILNGQVPENSISGDLSTDWVQRLLLSEELKALAANIYEAISH